MKIKHSKYKNTGILFELLVWQIASDTVSGKDSAAINLVKKYFNKYREDLPTLLTELQSYDTKTKSPSI